MANNVFQVKRTNVTGRTPNTTGSYVTNSQYIAAGEFALNMADGILYTSNGSAVITVGSNLVNQNITGNLTVKAIIANGSIGTAGQVLTTNSTGVYWSTVTAGGSGTVTQVNTGNGMTGGPITTTGTVSILANSGITANSTGTFVTQGTGTVVNATGVHVNATYIGTISANNASFLNSKTEGNLNVNNALTANNSTNLGGQAAAYYTNATNITTGTLPYAQIPANIINTTAAFTISGVHTYNANVVIGTAAGISANGGFGTAGQVLHSNGTSVYWAADDNSGGTVTSITMGNGLSSTQSPLTTSGTMSVVAGTGGGLVSNSTGVFVTQGTGTVVNATGVHVNSTYIGTLTANNTTYVNGKTEGNLNVNNATTAYGKTEGNLNVNSALYANASNSSNFANLATYVSTATTTNTFNVGTSTYFLANGNVGIGNSSPSAPFTIQKAGSASTIITKFVTEITGTAGSLFDYEHYNSVDGNGSAQIRFNKANGTVAAPTIVGTDRVTGRFGSRGYDGTAFYDNALIRMAVDGAPGTGSMPGRLEFWTTPSGSTTLVERMRITSTGNVGISNTAPADKFSVNGTSYFGANVTLTAALIANGGAGSAGQVLHSNGTATYWAAAAGGGYYKGGSAAVGTLAVGGQNLFRVNANTLNFNTTIAAGENAQATGPIAVAAGITLTVASGARVSIV